MPGKLEGALWAAASLLPGNVCPQEPQGKCKAGSFWERPGDPWQGSSPLLCLLGFALVGEGITHWLALQLGSKARPEIRTCSSLLGAGEVQFESLGAPTPSPTEVYLQQPGIPIQSMASLALPCLEKSFGS